MRARLPLIRVVFVVLLIAAAAPGAAGEASFPLVAKLTGADTAAGDEFGISVAIEGDRILVGAFFDDDKGPGSGSAYLFERVPSAAPVWRQVAKLVAPDGQPGDWFGGHVDLSGDTAIVAASVNDQSRFGYVWIFELDAGGPGAWGAVAKLLSPGGDPADHFASGRVALDGDTVAAGAYGADGPGSGSDGAVYAFARDAGGADAWGETATVTPANGCLLRSPIETYCGWGDRFFGSSVALSGDTLVVGNGELSGGYAYVYRRAGPEPGSPWRRLTRLAASDVRLNGFGGAVAISGETLLVSAWKDDDLGGQAGAAYVFEPDPGGPQPWREAVKLHAPDGHASDYFGDSVAIDGDTVVVGATQVSRDWQGKAYVFRRDAGGAGAWGFVAKLEPDELEPFDNFGDAVAVSGETVVVGAAGDGDRGDDAGAVYVFQEIPAPEVGGEGGGVIGAERGGAGATGQGTVAASGPGSDSPGASRRDEPERAWRARPIEDGIGAAAAAGARDPAPALALSPGPLCFDFQGVEFGDYCDALELTLDGGTLTGLWRNTDCEGTDVPVRGTLANGRVRVRCDGARDPCPAGFTWEWILDGPLDGTLDMLQLDGIWSSWIDELPYTMTTGHCALAPSEALGEPIAAALRRPGIEGSGPAGSGER